MCKSISKKGAASAAHPAAVILAADHPRDAESVGHHPEARRAENAAGGASPHSRRRPITLLEVLIKLDSNNAFEMASK